MLLLSIIWLLVALTFGAMISFASHSKHSIKVGLIAIVCSYSFGLVLLFYVIASGL